MNDDKKLDLKLDRKSFLTSAVGSWALMTLNACSDEGDGGGTDDGTGGTASGGTANGGTMAGGGMTGGSTTGGSAGAGAGGMSTGGSGGTGGDMFTCTADSDNGDHSHPVTIPSEDIVNGSQDAPYLLEDGGTGHTHTLELSAYEWFYLYNGMQIEAPSSMDAGHVHNVVVNCVLN
jgi:hypothetical protein